MSLNRAEPLRSIMRRTRRTFLGAVGAAATLSTAGCLGGNGGGNGGCDLQEEEAVDQMPTPVIGDPDAPVTVMAFEDYACPHCATYSLDVLPKLREEFVDPGKIRYEFRDFPLPVNKWSWNAASAARGVQDSVDDATYFDFAHELFENQDSYSMSLVQDLADEAGADGCDIRGDAKFGTYRPFLEAEQQRAVDRGLQGTPTVVVGDRRVNPEYGAIRSAVQSQLDG